MTTEERTALAALEQEWRNHAAYLREHCFDKREDGEADGVNSCADDLAALRVRFEGEESNNDERIRLILWLTHGHSGIYGDDGEMQCCECLRYGAGDYKRDPMGKLLDAYDELQKERVAKVFAARLVEAPGPDPEPVKETR